MSEITVLIADDQPLIRDGLAAILNMEAQFAVVAKAGDGEAVVALARLHRPQLVLMDIHMPKLDGLEALRRIKQELPDTKVLILTTFGDEQYIWDAIRHGASGFLVKGVETAAILSAIQDCLNGRINFPSSIQPRLTQALLSSERTESRLPPSTEPTAATGDYSFAKLNGLSMQERNIVQKLQQGKSNQAIASELYLTTGTVKNYLSAIYKKLNVSSRSETLAYLYDKNNPRKS